MCVILLGCVQIWHFYCTLFRGLLFFRTQCIYFLQSGNDDSCESKGQVVSQLVKSSYKSISLLLYLVCALPYLFLYHFCAFLATSTYFYYYFVLPLLTIFCSIAVCGLLLSYFAPFGLICEAFNDIFHHAIKLCVPTCHRSGSYSKLKGVKYPQYVKKLMTKKHSCGKSGRPYEYPLTMNLIA